MSILLLTGISGTEVVKFSRIHKALRNLLGVEGVMETIVVILHVTNEFFGVTTTTPLTVECL